jgi:phosphotransferase system HPr (HPr) family protein
MMHPVAMREVIVISPQGLHARPADLFAKMASSFSATIEVVKDGQRANGKSILDILMLAAEEGTTLTIVASGNDAHEAVEALATLVGQLIFDDEAGQAAGTELHETGNDETGSAQPRE